MSCTSINRVARFALFAAGLLQCAVLHADDVGEVQIIINEGSQSVAKKSVLISDIAEITGGIRKHREEIGKLDIDSLEPDSASRQITRRQVELRILLAGHQQDDFAVSGPSKVSVQYRSHAELRGGLETLCATEIARQFGLESDSVRVRFLNEDQVRVAESKMVATQYSATVVLEPQLPIGRTNIHVEFLQSGGNRFLEQFDAQVILTRRVALAAASIPKGTTIVENMLRIIERPIVAKADFADVEQVIGRVAQRPLPKNTVVLNRDLADKNTLRQKPLIQRNDLLDVIIRVGRGEVRLKNAQALSAGKEGETIIVLNTRSNKRLNATVIDRNLALVGPFNKGVR